MSTLDIAAKLIAEFEGLKLKAYRDPIGIWTIGVGHTGPDVKSGSEITVEEATRLLYADMVEADRVIDDYVEVSLGANQRAALISFIFNLGAGNFRSSTLLKLINAGAFTAAAQQFPRWNKAAGMVLPGLVKRRAAERELFES